jgi:hypothetical protein
VPPALDGSCAVCQGEKRSSSGSGLCVNLTVADWTRCFSIVMGISASRPSMLLVRRTCKAIGPMRDQPHSRQLHRMSGAGRARRSRPRRRPDHGDGIVTRLRTPVGSSDYSRNQRPHPVHQLRRSEECSKPERRRHARAPSYQPSRHSRPEALTPRSRQGAVQRTCRSVRQARRQLHDGVDDRSLEGAREGRARRRGARDAQDRYRGRGDVTVAVKAEAAEDAVLHLARA